MAYYFFNKLIAPRLSFAQHMTDNERRLMQEHTGYWAKLAQEGIAIVSGPLFDLDADGGCAISIVVVDREEDAKALTENDPVIQSDSQFRYQTHPMPFVVQRMATAEDRGAIRVGSTLPSQARGSEGKATQGA
jgi:uncharacterized protein YciI